MIDPSIIAAGISSLGSIATGGFGGIFAASSSRKAYEYAKALQQHQYTLQQQGYREGPTNARQGLESAGYNPILAITNGSNFAGSVAGGTPVGTNQPDFPDLGKSISNAYQTFKLNKQSVNNQTLTSLATADQANAQAQLNKEQAITEQAKRTQMEFQNAMYDVEKHLKEKELSWADRKFYSEIYDNMQRAENYGAMASIARYNAQTERTNSLTNAMNAETNRLQFTNAQEANRLESDWIKRHPVQASWQTGINRWTKSVSPWTSNHTVVNSYDANGNFRGQKHTTSGKGRARR